MKPIRIAIAALTLLGAFSSLLAQTKWVPRIVGGDGSIRDILWTGKVFVAVDYRGSIYSSVDGESWTKRDSSTEYMYYSVVRSPTGRYVAGGDKGLAISDDGVAWRKVKPTGGRFGIVEMEELAVIGNVIFGIDDGRNMLSSVNDTAWTPRAEDLLHGGADFGYMWQVASNGKVAVAVGHQAWKRSMVLTSPDGENWTARFPAGFEGSKTVKWVKDRFFAADVGNLASSTDGISWTNLKVPTGVDVRDLAWTGKRFVAVTLGGGILISPDGVAWDGVAVQDTTARFEEVFWTGSRLLLGGSRNRERFLATLEEEAIGIRPSLRAAGGLAWAAEGGWLTASLPPSDRLVRACLRNTAGMELRSAGPDAKGGLRMPLAGLGRGAYVLELEGVKERRSAPVLLAR